MKYIHSQREGVGIVYFLAGRAPPGAALLVYFLMFRDFEYPFYFRQCIHSIRYIIAYNIFIIAL